MIKLDRARLQFWIASGLYLQIQEFAARKFCGEIEAARQLLILGLEADARSRPVPPAQRQVEEGSDR